MMLYFFCLLLCLVKDMMGLETEECIWNGLAVQSPRQSGAWRGAP